MKKNTYRCVCAVLCLVAQLRPTLCDSMDCSAPGSSVHGILQARILEWVVISFSRGSSRPRDQTRVSRIGGRCFNLWATREACQKKNAGPQVQLEFQINNSFLWMNMPRGILGTSYTNSLGFPGGSVVKNLPANAGDAGSIPGSRRFPGEGNDNPL